MGWHGSRINPRTPKQPPPLLSFPFLSIGSARARGGTIPARGLFSYRGFNSYLRGRIMTTPLNAAVANAPKGARKSGSNCTRYYLQLYSNCVIHISSSDFLQFTTNRTSAYKIKSYLFNRYLLLLQMFNSSASKNDRVFSPISDFLHTVGSIISLFRYTRISPYFSI